MMKDRARTLFYSYMGVLLFLFVLKLLGYPGLALACENETVIAICNYVDNTFIKYILEFLMFLFTTTLLIQSIFCKNKFEGKEKFIYLFISVAEIIRLIFVQNMFVTLPIDIILVFIIPIIYNKKLFLNTIIVNLIVFGFQFLSFFVKEISIYKCDINNTLTAIIYSLDYIIMLLLLRDFLIDKIFNRKEK